MRIGLYFGSFNPIHTGHLIIANHILNETALQQIWMVVSPQNPFKLSHTLLNEYDRLHLVRKAIEGDERLRASEIEFGLPKPSYTVQTLIYLAEKYPKHQFSIIMGSDSFQNIDRWKNAEVIKANYPILVYQRPMFHVEKGDAQNVTLMDAPLLEISATYIRDRIKAGKSIRYLVPKAVEDEITLGRFYQHQSK